MRILVIEDDVVIADAVQRGLTAEGFAVEIAGDGDDGLWMATEGTWDAIVLDLMLPGRDGLSVCRELRAAGRWTPILMLTARDAETDQTRGRPRRTVISRRSWLRPRPYRSLSPDSSRWAELRPVPRVACTAGGTESASRPGGQAVGYPHVGDIGARGPRSHLHARPSFAHLRRIDAETRSPAGMMVVMDDLEALARMGTAQLRALVTPPRRCRHCGVELADRPGRGRPLVWCETHRTVTGRRLAGRVCAGCGASLDGRRRQAIVCDERCRARSRRRMRRA